MQLLLLLLAVAPILVVLALMRRREIDRAGRSATVRLEVDEFGVRRELADGRTEEIDWPEVVEVEVYRTVEGPHGPAGGMVMLSGDSTRGALVPLDRVEECALLERISCLPGFSIRGLAEALDSDAPKRVTVWRRDS